MGRKHISIREFLARIHGKKPFEKALAYNDGDVLFFDVYWSDGKGKHLMDVDLDNMFHVLGDNEDVEVYSEFCKGRSQKQWEWDNPARRWFTPKDLPTRASGSGPRQMDYLTFLNLVRAMREAQRNYLRKRDQNALLESRRMEVEVDRAIKAFDQRQEREHLRTVSPELPF